MSHTAGPWATEPGDSVIVVHADDDLRIASVGSVPYWKRFTEMDAANARLICAAPDLLEALRAVVAVADRKTVEFDMARAAIAKAEGEALTKGERT